MFSKNMSVTQERLPNLNQTTASSKYPNIALDKSAFYLDYIDDVMLHLLIERRFTISVIGFEEGKAEEQGIAGTIKD